MKELYTRAISGLIYALLLVSSLFYQPALAIVLGIFGFVCLLEFSKLINLKSYIQYLIFFFLYGVFGYLCLYAPNTVGAEEAIQILLVITVFVDLILFIAGLSKKRID